MKKLWIPMMLTASLMAPSVAVFGDDTMMDTAKHPQVAYDKHEVRSDAENQAIYKQKMEETKASLDQAKKDLVTAQSANDAKVIKEAEKRVNDLQKKYDKLARKYGSMKQETKEDVRDLQKAQETATK